MGKEVKTNAVRILERNKVPYELLTYECDEFIDGIHSAEATGYVRGGCSPLGMKKAFPTVIDASARQYSEIYVSGGRIGTSIRLDPQDLARVVRATFADILARP